MQQLPCCRYHWGISVSLSAPTGWKTSWNLIPKVGYLKCCMAAFAEFLCYRNCLLCYRNCLLCYRNYERFVCVCVCVDLKVSEICFFRHDIMNCTLPCMWVTAWGLILLYCIVCKLIKIRMHVWMWLSKMKVTLAASWPDDIFPYWHVEAEQLRLTGSSGSCVKSTHCAMQPPVVTRCGSSVEWSLLLY